MLNAHKVNTEPPGLSYASKGLCLPFISQPALITKLCETATEVKPNSHYGITLQDPLAGNRMVSQKEKLRAVETGKGNARDCSQTELTPLKLEKIQS